MTPSRSSTRESPLSHMADHADWLPPAREDGNLFMRDSRVMGFVELHSSTDWFLRFALAIARDAGDVPQAKMVAKAYAFLRDFMPSGLTGQWSHIMGQDVMDVLMSHTKDLAVTRHKATKDIQAAFTQLGDLMKTGATFKEALRNEENLGKGKERKALTLYSPAHLMALLIISYPDAKFRQWIGRLQIQWMMHPLEAMPKYTRDGFWEDLTAADLSMFQREPPCVSANPLLADYNRLFGPGFLEAAKDFRPFLPSWVKAPFNLDRSTPAIDEVIDMDGHQPDRTIYVESSGSVGNAGSGGQAEVVAEAQDSAAEPLDLEVLDLCKHLNPDPRLSEPKLVEWVGEWLGKPSAVFLFWCQSWADRMDKARHFQDQVLLQSLFMQSLYRVYSLSNAAAKDPMSETLMLLDVEDGKSRILTEAEKKSIRRLEKSPVYKPLLDAKTKLIEDARDTTIRDLLPGIYDEQMGFFCELIKSSTFNNQHKKAIKLDTLRTKAITQGTLDKTGCQLNRSFPDLPSPGVSIDSTMINRLRLTKWQLRMLAVSGLESAHVLTDWQASILHPKDSILEICDLSQYRPVHAQTVYCKGKAYSPETWEVLHKLFGSLRTAFTRKHGIEFGLLSQRTKSIPPRSPCTASTRIPNGTSVGHIPLNDNIQVHNPAEANQNEGLSPEPPPLGLPMANVFSRNDRNSESIPPTSPTVVQDAVDVDGRTWAPATLRKDHDEQSHSSFPGPSAPPSTGGDWNPLKGRVAAMKRSRSPGPGSALARKKFPRLGTKDSDPMADLKSNLKADISDWLQNEVKDMVGEIMDSIDGCALVSTKHQKSMEDKVGAIAKSLEELRKINDDKSAGRVPLPGQEGYLKLCCPAPPGWDPKAYESTLVRAALFYVVQLGEGAGEGFEADEEAFALMVEKFPNVVRPHLLASLQHLHTWAYGRPFQYE